VKKKEGRGGGGGGTDNQEKGQPPIGLEEGTLESNYLDDRGGGETRGSGNRTKREVTSGTPVTKRCQRGSMREWIKKRKRMMEKKTVFHRVDVTQPTSSAAGNNLYKGKNKESPGPTQETNESKSQRQEKSKDRHDFRGMGKQKSSAQKARDHVG